MYVCMYVCIFLFIYSFIYSFIYLYIYIYIMGQTVSFSSRFKSSKQLPQGWANPKSFHVSFLEGTEDDAVRPDPALCYGTEDPEQVVLVPWVEQLSQPWQESNIVEHENVDVKNIFGAIHLWTGDCIDSNFFL